MYRVDWTLTAEETYLDEIETISNKWSKKYIEEFIDLVDDWVQKLSSGILTGKLSSVEDVRILVVSKQTSLAYKVFEKESKIELLTFWKNQLNHKTYRNYFKYLKIH